MGSGSLRQAAQRAVDAVATVFDDWGPKVDKQIRSGSPAAEIIEAATEHDAGLSVMAAEGRGISDVILIGAPPSWSSTTPCPVLVVRRASPPRKTTRRV